MMEEYWWVREVNEIAAQDPWHQKLTQALHEQAAPFQRLCEKLPSQDTEILMDYISAVEELGYSRTGNRTPGPRPRPTGCIALRRETASALRGIMGWINDQFFRSCTFGCNFFFISR